MADTPTPTAEDHAQLVTDYLKQGWNQGEFPTDAVTDEYVAHVNRPDNTYTITEMQALTATWREAFPDLRLEIIDTIATEQTVAVRYRWTGTHEQEILGIEPTGTTVEVHGMGHFRIEDGNLAEAWYTEDVLGLRAQLSERPE